MEEVAKLAKELIAIPSVSGGEAEILKFCADWFRGAEFDDVFTDDMFTAGVVRAASGTASRALILCGHVDTVAPGDESAWSRSPWRAYVRDGRLYGLGSGDMKMGVALQMIVAKEYINARRDNLDVWCVVVANEEVDGAGSAAFAKFFTQQTNYAEASCLIAEPTDGDRIEVGHRGNRFVELEFSGTAGHASQEENYQASALPKMVHFLIGLPDIRETLHQTYRHNMLGEPSFTPTRVSPSRSFSANKTADKTYVALDIRTTPGLDEAFERQMNVFAEEYDFSWRYAAEPVSSALCADDASILRAVQTCLPKGKVSVSLGATDQAFFQNIGVQTVVYGPGDFARAHTTDESVSLEKAKTALAVYRRVIALL